MKKHNTGVTLVELMIATTVMGMIFIGIVTFFTQGVKFFNVSKARQEVQRDARMVLSEMNRKLREAISTSTVIDRVDDSHPPYSRIYFETIKGEKVYYYQESTKLYRKIVNGTTRIRKLTENLRYVLFVYPQTSDRTILSISICLEKTPAYGQTKAMQLSVEKIRIMN